MVLLVVVQTKCFYLVEKCHPEATVYLFSLVVYQLEYLTS